MLNSVEGIYRDSKVELIEPVPVEEEGRVIVTFLNGASHVDLETRGIDPRQAADLRRRLGAFADDWQRAEMDVYDAI